MLPGRAPEHLLGLGADGEHLAAAARVLLHRDDGGLVADDALALHVDQRVGGAEIDGEVVREHAPERVENHATAFESSRVMQAEFYRRKGTTPAPPNCVEFDT